MVDTMKVVYGGWYQRTTLHLSEVQRFFLSAASNGDLDKETLQQNKKNLDIKTINRKSGYLEYLSAITNTGIEIRYFEDGLYTLSKKGTDYETTKKEVIEYFKTKYKPAIGYLFSLGAPTPKVLSNTEEKHSLVVGLTDKNPAKKQFGNKQVYLETTAKDIKVSKTKENIIITVTPRRKKELDTLIDMQIFFSDFKQQLHKYLDIHRKIWEEISQIKEQENIRGKDVGPHKAKLYRYQKTIQLIRNRINQMRPYANTRKNISRELGIETKLSQLFQYRFEDLFNTLDYIREIWSMTLDYVDSGIRVLGEVESQSSSKGIHSIRLLVGVGVIMGFLNYMREGTFTSFNITYQSILFFIGFVTLGLIIDKTMKYFAKRKKYHLNFIEREEKI